MRLFHFAFFASLSSRSWRLKNLFNRKGRQGFRQGRQEVKLFIKQVQNH
jgi:hypothetical protein